MNGHLSKYIRFFRLWNNYKQAFVAKQLGMSQSNYHKLESGRQKLSKKHLMNLAGLYSISVDDFIRLDKIDPDLFLENVLVFRGKNTCKELNIEYLKLFKAYIDLCVLYEHQPTCEMAEFSTRLLDNAED